MKIAINTLGSSKIKVGIGNYVVNLVNELQKLDFENDYLILVGRENRGLFAKSKNFKFVTVWFWNQNKLLRIFWEQLILPFRLLIHRIDILHSPGFVSPILKTTKQIITIHDMTFFTHPNYHLKSKVKYFQNMIPISAKNANWILTDSENTKKDVVEILGTDQTKIKTVYFGTNFKFLKGSSKFIKQKYKLNCPFILFVGMIEPRKNIFNLIRAFSKISSKIKHKLVIVGKKGWMYDEIFELVEKLTLREKVIFTDYVSDKYLEYFYSAADLFIYPSYYEGFGIPVIEAMACGCPVITSNNSCLSEIAKNAAVLINNPDDTEEIAQKIKRVLFSSIVKQNLSKKGLTRAKDFSWQKTAAKTLEVYKCV